MLSVLIGAQAVPLSGLLERDVAPVAARDVAPAVAKGPPENTSSSLDGPPENTSSSLDGPPENTSSSLDARLGVCAALPTARLSCLRRAVDKYSWRTPLVLDSEGEQEAEVNLAEGRKAATVLASEASMAERINLAKGEAAAIEAQAAATAKAVSVVASALGSERGQESAALRVAEQYVSAFKGMAASGGTVIVPANAADVGGMVAQAMAVYKATAGSVGKGGGGGGGASPSLAAGGGGSGSFGFGSASSQQPASAFGGATPSAADASSTSMFDSPEADRK